MSEKVLLTVIGVMVGFASFAAIGAAASLVMAEVQERSTPQLTQVPVGYAQMRGPIIIETR
jgi:hypothetical protein